VTGAGTYAGTRLICDADAHLMETKSWLHEYADPAVRPLLAPMNLAAFPDPALRPDYTPDFYEVDWNAAKVADAEAHLMERKQWAALGAVDRVERSRALDAMGFHRQFVFATFCWGQFDSLSYAPLARGRDPRAVYGGARAHNRGVAEFCADDPRLMASGMAPLDVPELAVELVDELLAGGCRGVVIPSGVGPRGDAATTWSHPDNDPVWARLAEAAVPAVMHIGTGLLTTLPTWLYRNGKRPTYMLAGDGMEGWQVQDLYPNWWTVPLFLSALAVDGVFERHPGLKVAVCEYEAGWLPHFMKRVDAVQATAVRVNPEDYRLPMKASEYIRDRVKFAPVPGNPENWHWVMDSIDGGEHMLMFNSDYPHSEGGVDPIANFELELVKFGDRADEVRELFYSQNFMDVFGE
jgi:uncharacterized protein